MARSAPPKKPATNVIDFFSTANAKTKSGTSRKKDTREVAIKNLRAKKAVRRIRAAMTAIEESLDNQIKAAMAQEFQTTGCAQKRRPETFTGTDGTQAANCQLRARSFGVYGMDDETVTEFEAQGLGDYIVTTTKFEIDAADLTDELKAQIVAKLSEIPGISAALFKPVIKRTLVPDALDRLFVENHDRPDFIAQTMTMLGTLSTRVDYNKEDDNLAEDSAIVASLLNPDDPLMGDIVRQAVKDPEKALNPSRSRKKAA